MYSRATFAVTIPLLGALLILCSPVHWAIGGADADVPKELVAKTITLQETNIALSKALRELANQTGNQVEDRRREKEDVKLSKLDLKNATFWQALDAIAKAADARVSLYERDGKIALMDGPHQLTPTSYSGLFRLEPTKLEATRDLKNSGAHTLLSRHSGVRRRRRTRDQAFDAAETRCADRQSDTADQALRG